MSFFGPKPCNLGSNHMKWVKLTSLIKLEWWKLDINTLNFSIKLSIVYGV